MQTPRNLDKGNSEGEEQRILHATARFVEREVAFMFHHRNIYGELRKVLTNSDNGALRFGHFFFNAFGAWYMTSMLVQLRALTETSARGTRALSLVGLLHRVTNTTLVPQSARDQAAVDIELVRREAAAVYVHTSQYITHRESSPSRSSVDENEAYRLLDLVAEILDRTLRVVLGANYEKLVIDVDPWWAENLFSFAWGKPSEFSERLSLGSEARIVRESQRRDFTKKAVYLQRPADDELELYGISREEFERLREVQYQDLVE